MEQQQFTQHSEWPLAYSYAALTQKVMALQQSHMQSAHDATAVFKSAQTVEGIYVNGVNIHDIEMNCIESFDNLGHACDIQF